MEASWHKIKEMMIELTVRDVTDLMKDNGIEMSEAIMVYQEQTVEWIMKIHRKDIPYYVRQKMEQE